jgi:hypothetical protein
MSPVSAPELPTQDQLHDAVRDAVDQAMAATRAWQRELDARIARIEGVISDLQLSDRARAATFSAVAPGPPAVRISGERTPPEPNVTPFAPLVVTPADPSGSSAVAAQPAPPAVAPGPLVGHALSVGLSAPIHAAAATHVVPYTGPTPSFVPRDFSLFPSGIDGGKRKRIIAIVALLMLLVGVGGLAVLAVASHSVHGL